MSRSGCRRRDVQTPDGCGTLGRRPAPPDAPPSSAALPFHGTSHTRGPPSLPCARAPDASNATTRRLASACATLPAWHPFRCGNPCTMPPGDTQRRRCPWRYRYDSSRRGERAWRACRAGRPGSLRVGLLAARLQALLPTSRRRTAAIHASRLFALRVGSLTRVAPDRPFESGGETTLAPVRRGNVAR